MVNNIINFNGDTYFYNDEQMCSDSQSLKAAYGLFKNCKVVDIFPQGVDFIESFLIDKIKSNDTIIILSKKSDNSPTTWFYFPFSKYSDLRYLKGSIIFSSKRQEEINNIEKYPDDHYPQGIDYCKKLLSKKFNKNTYPYLIMRPDGSEWKNRSRWLDKCKWTKYYFIKEYIPTGTIKSLNLLCGESQLKDEINLIKGNKTRNLTQGNEYCIDLINKELKSNGKIIVLCSEDFDTKNDIWRYFSYEQLDLISNKEWRVESDRILNEIELIKERNKIPNFCFPQGSEYCIQLLEDLYAKGETSHLLIVSNKNQYFFYFKE